VKKALSRDILQMVDPEFWHNKWATNTIGFHLNDVNPFLRKYWPLLAPQRHHSVFVPLCGKSVDLSYLAFKHDNVYGVELSDIAVRSFFAEHLYTPLVTRINHQHQLYQFDEINIYTGDVFSAPLPQVDIIYDRAALVALPAEMRGRYAQRMLSLLKPGGKILLVTVDYVQTEQSGPPFSVDETELVDLYSGCSFHRLARVEADDQHPKIRNGKLSRLTDEVWLIAKPM
jgi:thiopurine S-methyltransferase